MKGILKLLKSWLKVSLISIIAIISILIIDFRDTKIPIVDYSAIPVKNEYFRVNNKEYNDSLLMNFGFNKILPNGYENQALIALSHFPELKEVKIEFRFENLRNSALMSRPSLTSVFFPWIEKEYIILISNQDDNPLLRRCLLKNLPYNAQIGVMAHELSHITGYMQKKSYQLFFEFFKYEFSDEYFNELENKTEINVIDHGLGYQLLSWSEFQYFIKVRMGLGQAYLSPESVKIQIKKNPAYSEN
jgi:hypothetical protein